jgi:Transglutaminase-like superfamily
MQTSTPTNEIIPTVVWIERPIPPLACFLSAHAYACEFNDGAIILDLLSDTYLGINAPHLPGLRARVQNWPDTTRDDREERLSDTSNAGALIDDLIKRGILTTSPTSRQPPPMAIPTMALTVVGSAGVRGRIRLMHIAQFIIAFLVVALCLRRKRLPALIDWIRRRQFSIRCEHSIAREDAVTRLRSFLWLRTWFYTAQRRCLFDSLVLSVYLTRGMTPCTFVIAAATKPFLAHSWVQIGESVLNDTAERVQDFTPILSVGGK